MDSYSMRFPLPKNWPCGVKTAVVHVVALAHVAIVHARRLILNSPNARTGWLGTVRLCRMKCHSSKRSFASRMPAWR